MKTKLIAAGVLLASLTAAAPVPAQFPPPNGAPDGFPWHYGPPLGFGPAFAPGSPPPPPPLTAGMCREHFARLAGFGAYLEARLDLTAAQQPLWESVRRALQDSAVKERDACLAGVDAASHAPLGFLDRVDGEERRLAGRLDALRQGKPALEALYAAVTPEQRGVLDRLPMPRP